MARSKAKKERLKLEREGKRNPVKSRGGELVMISTHERKTKTKKEKMRQKKHKKQTRDYLANREDASFYFV